MFLLQLAHLHQGKGNWRASAGTVFSRFMRKKRAIVLIICASLILLGYVYHIFKIIHDLRPPTFWDLDGSWLSVSDEDYLPISIHKIWEALAFIKPHQLERLPVTASLADFGFAALLLLFTYRVVQGMTGRAGLAALYIITIAWAGLILKIEYARIQEAMHTNAFTPSNTEYYIMKPWRLQSVLPKVILVGASVAGLLSLWKQKAVDHDGSAARP